MYVYDHIVFCFVDCCTRWLHTIEITDKKEQSMVQAINSWVTIHGPMSNLIMDS